VCVEAHNLSPCTVSALEKELLPLCEWLRVTTEEEKGSGGWWKTTMVEIEGEMENDGFVKFTYDRANDLAHFEAHFSTEIDHCASEINSANKEAIMSALQKHNVEFQLYE